uniref:SAS-6_N domain-containing protein n=1 Tax=Rhabditophanes sp. KR3021 TaxID=114890 RepID=A0AC35TQK4_9BILA
MAVLFDDNIQFLVIKNESEEVVEKLKRYHVVVKGDREDTRSGIAIEVTEAGKISSVFRANLNTASFEILRKSQQLKTDFKQTRQTILDHLNDVKKRVKDSAVGGRAGVKSIWWEKDKTSGEMLMNLMEPMKTKSCVLVVLNFKAVMGTELIAYLEELSHSKDLRILDLKKTVEHKDSKICDLRKKLEENEKKLNLDIDKFHKECNEKDDLLEYAKEKNEILNDKIKELQEHINDLVEQVGEMQEDEKESKNEINVVCAENDELRNLQKRYENALEKVYNENQTLIAQVTECEDEFQKASKELLVQQKLLTSEKREYLGIPSPIA